MGTITLTTLLGDSEESLIRTQEALEQWHVACVYDFWLFLFKMGTTPVWSPSQNCGKTQGEVGSLFIDRHLTSGVGDCFLEVIVLMSVPL